MLVSLNETINLLRCIQMLHGYRPSEEEVMQMRLLEMALERIQECASMLGNSIAHMKEETDKLQEEHSTEDLILDEIEGLGPYLTKLRYFKDEVTFSNGIEPGLERDLKKSILHVLDAIYNIENFVRGD
ncbi:MAG: hypothetical protein KGI54_09595 [Pseudomonadota bacterium]|nr:hypothetical protein [Pseudomonadota bacterium]